MSARLTGLQANYALFDSLPQAAQEELGNKLGAIARHVLDMQRAAAPRGKTGRLYAGLTIAEAIEHLRVRIGYPSFKGRAGKVFYALFMEKGRRAQVVRVIRTTTVSTRTAVARRWGKAGRTLRKPYSLPVTPLPARRFVHIEDRIGQVTDRYMANFWQRTLNAAGAT